MIGKAKSNKSLSDTIQYNLKEKATLVYTNKLEGENINDFLQEMQDLQKCYRGYAKGLTIHAILSPSIEDGKKLTTVDWNKIADSYLKKMNLMNHQAVGFIHADKEHRHLHLVINKINERNFTLYHDGFIGKKSQKVADNIAKEMNLTRAREIQQERLKTRQRTKAKEQSILPKVSAEEPIGTKQQFAEALQRIIQNGYKNIQGYFKAIEQEGFTVHQYTNKATGELRGYGIEKNGTKMHASTIGKQFTLKALGLMDNEQDEKEGTKEEIATPVEELKDTEKIRLLENYLREIGIDKNRIKESDIKFLQQGVIILLACKMIAEVMLLPIPFRRKILV